MTALTLYLTNTTGTTLATTFQLSQTHGTDNTNVTQNYSLVGTATGWGEIYAQGNASAWAAGGSIGAPSGHGFMLETSVLNLSGNTLAAGSWTANVRLGAGHTDGTLTGSLTGCAIHVRLYKYNSGTYTPIIDMSLTSQTVNSTLTTFALSGTTGSSTAFSSGDLLYIDLPFLIGANSNGDAALNLRNNRLSTNSTGDSNAEVVTPGYASSGTTSTRTIPATVALKSTKTRTIPATVTLSGPATHTRTVPATVALKATKTRSIPATVSLTGGIVYDPTIQMDVPTLTAQYAVLINATLINSIKIIATVYFSNSVNNSVILGQICVVLNNETINNLHTLNTINDVTNFIATH